MWVPEGRLNLARETIHDADNEVVVGVVLFKRVPERFRVSEVIRGTEGEDGNHVRNALSADAVVRSPPRKSLIFDTSQKPSLSIRRSLESDGSGKVVGD